MDKLRLPEIYLIVCLILIIFFFGCIIFIKIKVTRKLSKCTKNETSTEYSKTKTIVCEYLDENPEVLKLGKQITVEKTSLNHTKKAKEAAADYFQRMLQNENLKHNHKKDLNKSIRFEMKRRLIRHPYDIRGSRRCYLLETILDSVWESMENSNEDKTKKYLNQIKNIFPTFGFPSCHGESMKKMIVVSIYVVVVLYVLIFSFGVWCYDVYTDGVVLYTFFSFMCLLDDPGRYCPMTVRSFLVKQHCFGLVDEAPGYTNITASCYNKIPGGNILQQLDEEKKNKIVAVVAVHNFILVVFYIAAIIHAITSKPFKIFLKQIQCSLLMYLSKHEQNDTEISTSVVRERYRINIDESGFEAIVNMSLQWASYYNLVYTLTKLLHNEASEEDIRELLGYNKILISGVLSLLSLVMAQMKAHNTQHKFNTSAIQKIFYFLACLANTLSYGTIFVVYLTYCVQYCASEFFVHSIGSPRYFGGYGFCGIVCLSCLACFKKITCTLHNLLFYRNDIFKKMKKDTPNRKQDIFGQWFNTGENLQLPPSNTWYETYNSYHSFSLLHKLSRQCFSYVFILCWICGQSAYSYFQFDFNPSYHPEFERFIYASMFLIPGGWVASYFFLWVFFRLDNGFFTATHIRFVYSSHDLAHIEPKYQDNRKDGSEMLELLEGRKVDSDNNRNGETRISTMDDSMKFDGNKTTSKDSSCWTCCDKISNSSEIFGYWEDLNEQLCFSC